MGTFLAPLPSPPPAVDADFASILELLAMHDDVGAEPPPPPPLPDGSSPFAAGAGSSSSSTTLPAAFFVRQHDDQPSAMPFQQPGFLSPHAPPLLPLPAGGPAAAHDHHHAAVTAPGASRRPGANKRKRGRRQPPPPAGSPSSGSTGAGQEAGAGRARARAGRRVWVRERSTEWWDRLGGASCPDAEFRRAFRMSRATFAALCGALGGAVAREDTALRAAVPVRRRVAACLWRLATGEPLREVSRRFGLGVSTCHAIVLQVCRALAAVLMPAAIRWPDDAPAAAAAFEAASGIPGVVGAVYTTRVPVVAPRDDSGAAYRDRRLTERNRRASYSIALQAVADADGAFTEVSIGLPGSLSDAAVLARSALSARRRGGAAGGPPPLGGQPQQQWLVGGASYPLTDWMLVPYGHRNLTWAQHAFNEQVAAARGVAPDAVRRLKARWRCLQRRTEMKAQDLPSMIAACCVLHNICERAGEALDPDLMQYELDDDDDGVALEDAAPSAAAAQARDSIAHGLLHGDRVFHLG